MKFLKILEILCENPPTFFGVVFNVLKKNMLVSKYEMCAKRPKRLVFCTSNNSDIFSGKNVLTMTLMRNVKTGLRTELSLL